MIFAAEDMGKTFADFYGILRDGGFAVAFIYYFLFLEPKRSRADRDWKDAMEMRHQQERSMTENGFDKRSGKMAESIESQKDYLGKKLDNQTDVLGRKLDEVNRTMGTICHAKGM